MNVASFIVTSRERFTLTRSSQVARRSNSPSRSRPGAALGSCCAYSSYSPREYREASGSVRNSELTRHSGESLSHYGLSAGSQPRGLQRFYHRASEEDTSEQLMAPYRLMMIATFCGIIAAACGPGIDEQSQWRTRLDAHQSVIQRPTSAPFTNQRYDPGSPARVTHGF